MYGRCTIGGLDGPAIREANRGDSHHQASKDQKKESAKSISIFTRNIDILVQNRANPSFSAKIDRNLTKVSAQK